MNFQTGRLLVQGWSRSVKWSLISIVWTKFDVQLFLPTWKTSSWRLYSWSTAKELEFTEMERAESIPYLASSKVRGNTFNLALRTCIVLFPLTTYHPAGLDIFIDDAHWLKFLFRAQASESPQHIRSRVYTSCCLNEWFYVWLYEWVRGLGVSRKEITKEERVEKSSDMLVLISN